MARARTFQRARAAGAPLAARRGRTGAAGAGRPAQDHARLAPADEERHVRVALADPLRLDPSEPIPCSSRNASSGSRTTSGASSLRRRLLRRVDHLGKAMRRRILRATASTGASVSTVPSNATSPASSLAPAHRDRRARPGAFAAADFSIGVPDFEFAPKAQRRSMSATRVTWNFETPRRTPPRAVRTTRALDLRAQGRGGTFTARFTKPGRYQYVCSRTPHEGHGELVSGIDAAKTLSTASRRRERHQRRSRFKLKEAARRDLLRSQGRPQRPERKRPGTGKPLEPLSGLNGRRLPRHARRQDDFDKDEAAEKSLTVR